MVHESRLTEARRFLLCILLFTPHTSHMQEAKSPLKQLLIGGCVLFFSGYIYGMFNKNITGTHDKKTILEELLLHQLERINSNSTNALLAPALVVYFTFYSRIFVARANKTFLERKKIKKPDMSLTIPFVPLADDDHHAALLASIKQRESILHKERVRAHEIALINDIKQSGSTEHIQMLWDLQEKKSLANKMIKAFFQHHLAENKSEAIASSVDDLFALLPEQFYRITKQDLLALASTFIQEKNKLITLIQQHNDVHDVNNEHAAITALVNLYDQVPLLNLERAIYATVRSPFCYGMMVDVDYIFDMYEQDWQRAPWSNEKASFFYQVVTLLLFQRKNEKADTQALDFFIKRILRYDRTNRLTGAQRQKILALIHKMHNEEAEMQRCLPPPITRIIYDYCEKFI